MFLSIYIFTLFNSILFYLSSGSNNRGNRYLSVCFFLLAIRGFSFLPTMDEMHPLIQLFFFNHFLSLHFLLGPFVYFYFRFRTRQIYFSFKKDFIHFIAFFVALLNMLPYFFTSLSEKKILLAKGIKDFNEAFRIDFYFLNSSFYYLATPLFTLSYLVASLLLIIKYSGDMFKDLEAKEKRKFKKWISVIWGCFAALLWINWVLIYYVYLSTDTTHYPIYLATVLVLLYLNFQVYRFPQILYGIKFTQTVNNKSIVFIKKTKKNKEIDEGIIQKIDQLTEEYKQNLIFLEPNFTLQRMANDLKYPSYLLTKYFKERQNCRFLDYRNQLRIEYFINTFQKTDITQYKLQFVIKKYGYTNLASFKKAFLEVRKQEFRQFLLQKNS